MPDKNRSHGKIDQLPEEIRKEVENKLLGGCTYESIAAYLNGIGYEIHFTSVHRFGKPFLKQFESIKRAREIAQQIAEDNVDRPSTELNEANNALASQMLMELLVDEDMEITDKLKAMKSITALQQAQTQTERLKIYSRKEAGAVRTAVNMIKDRIFKEIQSSHPEIAAVMVGIAEDVAKEMQ